MKFAFEIFVPYYIFGAGVVLAGVNMFYDKNPNFEKAKLFSEHIVASPKVIEKRGELYR